MRCFSYLFLQNSYQVLKGTFSNSFYQKSKCGSNFIRSFSKTFIYFGSDTVCITHFMNFRANYQSKFRFWTTFGSRMKLSRFRLLNSNATQIHLPHINSDLLNLESNRTNIMTKRPFLSSSTKNYAYKKGSIENIHSHKSLTALKSKKRIHRKKKRSIDETSEEDAEGFQIIGHHKFLTFDPDFAIPDITVHKPPMREFQTVAYATADDYDLEKISEGLHKQGLYVAASIIQVNKGDDSAPAKSDSVFKLSDPEDVLHLNAAYQLSSEPRTLFIFREGSVVFWNVPSLERQNILKFLEKYQSGSYIPDIVEEETETLAYTYTDSATRLKPAQSLILLNENGEKNLEKYTFSNALAMSVKLGIWEASLDRYVESIEHVTEKLQESGSVALSQEQVLQRMGQLFALRHLINLSSDLLDTPDFYWEHESLGNLYNKTASYLSIQKRTSVMNTKLNHCLELMELLKGHLNERHSSRLEWIIIILIFIEVFFELIHLRYKGSEK